jgi:hypothetical protein
LKLEARALSHYIVLSPAGSEIDSLRKNGWQSMSAPVNTKIPSKPLTLDLMETLDLYTLDLQIWFCSFFVQDSSKEAAELAKKKSKLSMRSRVRGFYSNM